MSNPRPPSARGRGRGRHNVRNQSPDIEANSQSNLIQRNDGIESIGPHERDLPSGKVGIQSAGRVRKKRPEVQLYVPRGRRIQNQNNNEQSVGRSRNSESFPNDQPAHSLSDKVQTNFSEVTIQEKPESKGKRGTAGNASEKRRPRNREIYLPPSRRQKEQNENLDSNRGTEQKAGYCNLDNNLIHRETEENEGKFSRKDNSPHCNYVDEYWDEVSFDGKREDETTRHMLTYKSRVEDVDKNVNLGHISHFLEHKNLENQLLQHQDCERIEKCIAESESFSSNENIIGSKLTSQKNSTVYMDRSVSSESKSAANQDSLLAGEKDSINNQDSLFTGEKDFINNQDRSVSPVKTLRTDEVACCEDESTQNVPHHQKSEEMGQKPEYQDDSRGNSENQSNSANCAFLHDKFSATSNFKHKKTGGILHPTDMAGDVKWEGELTGNNSNSTENFLTSTELKENEKELNKNIHVNDAAGIVQHDREWKETKESFSMESIQHVKKSTDIDESSNVAPHSTQQGDSSKSVEHSAVVTNNSQQNELSEDLDHTVNVIDVIGHSQDVTDAKETSEFKETARDSCDITYSEQNKSEFVKNVEHLDQVVQCKMHQDESLNEFINQSELTENEENNVIGSVQVQKVIDEPAHQNEMFDSNQDTGCDYEQGSKVDISSECEMTVLNMAQDISTEQESVSHISHSTSKEPDTSITQNKEQEQCQSIFKGALKESEEVDGQDTADEMDEDSWDKLFDDDGECLDPQAKKELKKLVGKVKIKKATIENHDSEVGDPEFNYDDMNHVVEIYGFPAELKTQDLLAIFQPYKDKGFDIKWVDDTHALGVFSSSIAAKDALKLSHPFCKIGPLSNASRASKIKARRCTESLQPYKPRPETSATLARRLVTGALGLQSKVSKEQREAERKKLKEAREKKRKDKKQREDMWEGAC